MASKQPNKTSPSNPTSRYPSSQTPKFSYSRPANQGTGSTAATYGSASYLGQGTHFAQSNAGTTSSAQGSGQSWALDQWLKQKPRDEPWRAFSGSRE